MAMSGRTPVLGRRALNRALLHRQLLLQRAPMTAEAAVERLVGMQAQAPLAPYVGLWSRVDGFRPEEVAQALTDRRLVRMALMRSTIHLVTAADCLAMRPLLQPVLDRGLKGTYGRQLAGIDQAAVAREARQLLQHPMTLREVAERLQPQWPGVGVDALSNAVRAAIPLVQPPPRGVWGKGGLARHLPVAAWLPGLAGAVPPMTPEAMVRRYLDAFGPAAVADVQTWSGLSGLREVLERMRPGLRTYRDERGAELFDLPDGPLPHPDIPAPVRFLPEYDNLLLSHADRARVMADEHKRLIFTGNAILGSFLVDGFLAGSWKAARSKGTVTLTVTPFGPLATGDRMEVEGEAHRLVIWYAGEGTSCDVRLVPGL